MRGFLILDFGSQYTQVIARRLRDLGFYSEISAYDLSLEKIRAKNPFGIILSGGPRSVYEVGAPRREIQELAKVAPLMGICYGFQLMVQQMGGEVKPSEHREYGRKELIWKNGKRQMVWMSHGDVAHSIPDSFEVLAETEHHPAFIQAPGFMGLQFHPEVFHTERGEEFFQSFAQMCGAEPEWNSDSMVEEIKRIVSSQVQKDEKVLCALSGGVDSTVVATMLHKILEPGQLQCVFVDTGLMRERECEEVMEAYENLGLPVKKVEAQSLFLTALQGVSDPEKKRKIIGAKFIEVFDQTVKDMERPFTWLAQGTLYPDVIESVSLHGTSVTIKSHHNVGGLPEKMKMKVLEPVRYLFKDEVRKLGRHFGIPESFVDRHPFPGPGLAIRILGEVTEKKLEILRRADRILIDFLKEKKIYHEIWQAFCVLLPVQSVGVQGDARTYDQALTIRAVTSRDGMTADWYEFSWQLLRDVSNRMTNQVKGINRVVYDVTSKPPATIEWE